MIKRRFVFIGLFAVLFVGCSNSGSDTYTPPQSTDSDRGSDKTGDSASSGMETDTHTSSENDTVVDTVTEIDSDTPTGSDPVDIADTNDSESSSDTQGTVDTGSSSDDDTNTFSDTGSGTVEDAGADTDAHSDTETDTIASSDAGVPGGEDWDMYLTVDNQFDVYFGNPTGTTDSVVGGGSDWTVEYHFTAEGRADMDFLYVATASDQNVAQGFIGTFANLTRNKVTSTGDDVWQVFAAGAHPETNPYWPNPWPRSQMPTQEEVDIAIAFAQANDLWVTPVQNEGYDNDPSTPTDPYTFPWNTTYPSIPTTAKWIWHDKGDAPEGNMPSPLYSYNHDEFLVFRVSGQVAVIVI